MFALSRSTHIDRDDFDADHYADFIRDTHRSRLTLDQLDITKRQLRKKEKFLTRNHALKMKEHSRIKNDFIRKVEQDLRIANLPIVQETLKAERRKHSEPLPSSSSNEHPQKTTKQEEKSHRLDHRPKLMAKADSLRTERLRANLEKFNYTNTLLC